MNFLRKKDSSVPIPAPGTEFSIEKSAEIPVLPDFARKSDIDVKYPLIKPYSYAHIHWDEEEKEVVYELIEPPISQKERDILESLEKGLEELINISFINIKEESAVISYLEKNSKVLLSELGLKLPKDIFMKLMYYIYRDFVGLNLIESLMHDQHIEDIECNGVNTPLYIVHRKYRNLKTNILFSENEKLMSFVEKLAQKCGKYISYANPILDGRLPDKSRVNATYTQDISSGGPTFTIRIFTTEPWSPIKLIDVKTASPELLAYLWMLIEYESNIMIIGGTGTGKTSFLNSIAFFMPPQARIVSIEDTHELNLLHTNWLPSVSREATGVGGSNNLGEVSLFTLLKASFRQRPDYVIVGEIRGQEAYILFQGAASGHPTISTMHAEDVETMIRRLETPPINLPPSLVETIDAVCVMSQSKIYGNEVRRLKNITEIIRVSSTSLEKNTPFVWDPKTDRFFFKKESHIFKKLQTEYGMTGEQIQKEFERRTLLLWQMYKRGISGYREVHEIISAYYKTPSEVLKKFNIK
ncbi:MAG: type II/IV secretion system ATPase subunit [Nanoarchaeota archaeon]|nr:type II/IV secretion system ATPase subunit [Nanoarchaeota archaeon]